MNICQNCKTENDVNSKFCKNCGCKIVSETQEMELLNKGALDDTEMDLSSEAIPKQNRFKGVLLAIKDKTKNSIFFRSKKNVITSVIILALIIGISVVWKTGIVFNTIAGNIYDSYKAEEITYDEAIGKLNIVNKLGDIQWACGKCNDLKNSKEAYNRGMEYLEQNKTLDAIYELNKVIKDDKNFEQAKATIEPYKKEYNNKYRKCLESKDYASALVFYSSNFVDASSEDRDLIYTEITETYPTKYYKTIANKSQSVALPHAMKSSNKIGNTITDPIVNTMLNSWNFDEKYRIIPCCVGFDDYHCGFAVHIDDKNINKLYITGKNSSKYDVLIYEREKTGTYMYDTTQNSGYVQEGINNMIYKYVLNNEVISFKTDSGDIIVLDNDESRFWVETYALTCVCNWDSSIFQDKIKRDVF